MNNKKKDTNLKFEDVFPQYPRFTEHIDDQILEKLSAQLTTFHLAMERIGAGKGYDPLPIEEAKELSYFWLDINTNIRILMEMFDYAYSEINGLEYDPSKPGTYLWYRSLLTAAEDMNLKK